MNIGCKIPTVVLMNVKILIGNYHNNVYAFLELINIMQYQDKCKLYIAKYIDKTCKISRRLYCWFNRVRISPYINCDAC